MTGWAIPFIVVEPPSLFPSTPTRPVVMAGCVSTDGVRSSECSERELTPFTLHSINVHPLLQLLKPGYTMIHTVIARNSMFIFKDGYIYLFIVGTSLPN